MNEELLAQIINGMRMNQPQGAVGNVSNNEATMFSGNPMNGAELGANTGIAAMRAANNTGGAVGNGSNNEASMFNMMANSNTGGGISNPIPRINEMRNNLATAGSAGNATDIFTGRSKQEIAQIRQAQENLAVLKQTGQTRILTDNEKYQASQAQGYLQNISSPVEVMPPDIDNLNLPPEALRELLEVIENPNFRGFPMRGGR